MRLEKGRKRHFFPRAVIERLGLWGLLNAARCSSLGGFHFFGGLRRNFGEGGLDEAIWVEMVVCGGALTCWMIACTKQQSVLPASYKHASSSLGVDINQMLGGRLVPACSCLMATLYKLAAACCSLQQLGGSLVQVSSLVATHSQLGAAW